MILNRRPDIERFLKAPGPEYRAALFYGRDLGVVRERAQALAAVATERPDDPFDTALLTEADLDGEPGKLEQELAAQSLMGGRRLVRLRLSGDKISADKAAAEALTAHAAGDLNPDAFFLIEAGALGRDSAVRKVGEKSPACAVVPCYEDEPGDLARLTREALAADQVSLNAEALDLFVSRLPHERGVARREIERLALYLGPGSGRVATAADLTDFLGVEPEASLFDAAADAF
ncbi:MAG TPA: DNA polymerase III subunit delta, partial [Caulobacteraceae bacterium]|nr:DNA polymerase III subunit delta [Caulobacteraceae bacterium]